MRYAYADPPYLGCCRLYGHNHPTGLRTFDGRCWDDVETHELLIEWLCAEYPAGWALSASAPSLRRLLPFAPADARVAPWCKSFCAFKRGVRPAYAWEPVIFRSTGNPPHTGHPPPLRGGKQTTPKDFFVGPITLKKGLTGAKSPEFCEWVLSLLNYRPDDTLDDIFVGTGVMGRTRDALDLARLLGVE